MYRIAQKLKCLHTRFNQTALSNDGHTLGRPASAPIGVANTLPWQFQRQEFYFVCKQSYNLRRLYCANHMTHHPMHSRFKERWGCAYDYDRSYDLHERSVDASYNLLELPLHHYLTQTCKMCTIHHYHGRYRAFLHNIIPVLVIV